MVKSKLRNKPSFKVKHPYGNLITSIFAGVIFMVASVLSLSTSFFGLSDSFKTFAFTGNGSSETPYVIYTKDDFTSSTIQTALASSTSYVVLGGNINLGTTLAITSDFKANFDGKHYTITSSVPFVNNNRGTIKNTKFVFAGNTYSYSSKVVDKANYGTLENLRIENSFDSVKVNVNNYGGFANVNYGTITQSINAQSIVNTYTNSTGTAGIVATNYATVNTSVNRGNITVTGLKTLTDKQTYGVAAGIVAVNDLNASYTNSITDSYNEGTIQASNGGSDTIGNGVRGAHAGGIVGVNNATSGTRATVNRTINYGKVFAGNGGHGKNGSGGTGGTQTVGGTGGTGGFGGGAGGNASGIVGYVANSNFLTVSNSFNFGTLLSGKGGNGGIGGGGGGGSFGLGSKPATEISISVQSTNGNGNGVGGSGAIASSYYAGGQAVTYGAGGGGGGGGAGASGLVDNQFTTTLTNDGSKGSSGSNGTASVAGMAGTSGTHRGNSVQSSFNGVNGEKTYYIEGHFGKYTIYAGNGGNGGLGGLGGIANTSYTKVPSINKTTYTTFDFVSNNGWNMTDTKPILRFEQGDTYVNVAFAVFYKGVNVTQTSSTYLTLSNDSSLGSFQYKNGVWQSYTNPVLGGNISINASVNSYFKIANAGNYIYSVSGVEEVVALSKPTSYGATISKQFNMSDEKFRSNDDNIIEVTINVYDQLQGTGTEASPYLIQNFYDFANMDVYDSATTVFKLNNNITEVSGYNNSYILPNFTGKLLGNGKTITRNGNYNRSLILANNGTITNLNILVGTSTFAFNENVFGLLVSDNQSGTITNVKVVSSQTSVAFSGTGEVNFAFGAVAGWNSGTMEQISNHMNFTVSFTTNQTYTSSRYVGGLVGLNKANAQLFNSKNVANITFVETVTPTNNVNVYLGGIAGSSEAVISNVYNIGNLVSTTTTKITDYVSGIANSSLNVNNSYFNGTISNASYTNLISTTSSGSYSNITSAKPMSDYFGWNFNSIWVHNSYVNNGLPALRFETGEEMGYSLEGLDLTQKTVTVTTALQLASLLKNIASFVPDANTYKTIIIGANIDMRGYTLPQVNIPKNVTLKGNLNTIYNITSKNSILNTNFGVVSQLKVNNSLVTFESGQHAGGLFIQNDGELNNVLVETSVLVSNATGVSVGGMVSLNNGTITESVVSGKIEIKNSTNISLGGVAVTSGKTISKVVEAVGIEASATTFANIGRLVATANNLSSDNNISYGTISGYTTSIKMFGSTAGFVAVNNYLLNSNATAQTGVTLLSSAQFKNSSSFTNFNFINTWYQQESQNPTLWFAVAGAREVSVELGSNTIAYANLYSSAGKTLNTITTSGKLWVVNGDTISKNLLPANLNTLTNTVVFASTDGEAYYISVMQNETQLINEGNKAWNHGVTITSALTGNLTYTVVAWNVYYSITLNKPLINGSSSNLGVFKLSIVRNAQTTTPSVAYDVKNEFVYDSLLKGDKVTLTYSDTQGNSLKTINDAFNYYLSNLTQNGSNLTVTRNANSVTATFDVTPQTAGAVSSVKYAAAFTKLNSVSLVFNTNDVITSENYGIASTANASVFYQNVNVLTGTEIKVSVPSEIRTSESAHNLAFSNFTFSNHTVTYTGTSATFTVSNDVIISANYSASYYDVTIELQEEFTTGENIKHNAILVNGEELIQNALSTYTVSANANLTITVLAGSPNTIIPQVNTNGYWAWYYDESVIPSGAALSGLFTQGYNVLEPLYNAYTTYKGYYTSEISFSVSQNYVGENKVVISFARVKAVPFTQLQGEGTEQNPYKISSANDLFLLSQSFETGENSQYRGGKHFALQNDIDVKVYTSAYGQVASYFNPIGTEQYPFDGHFDGGTYSIKNLLIENEHANYVGLFGVTTLGSTLHHVYLENATVLNNKVNAFVGGLVGLNNGTITNSAVSRGQLETKNSLVSSADLTNAYVGGLVGKNTGLIKSSYNNAKVLSDYFAGGLVGMSLDGEVIGSYNSGLVKAFYASGLVGKSGNGENSDRNLITYSYNSGAVNNLNGGLAYGITYNFAQNAGASNVTLKETYALDNVRFAFGNYYENGITGNINSSFKSSFQLSEEMDNPNYTNTGIDGVGYTFARIYGDEQYNLYRQFNAPYPIIAGFWYATTLEFQVYYNNELINSLDEFDVNDDGIRELNTQYPVNRPFVVTLYSSINYTFTIHPAYLVHFTKIQKVVNGSTSVLFSSVEPYSYTITESGVDTHIIYKLYLESYYLEVEYLGDMQTTSSVENTVISTFENKKYYALSKFTNVTLDRVQILNGMSYVEAVEGVQTSTSYGKITVTPYESGNFKGVQIELNASYRNVKIRILPQIIVKVDVKNLNTGNMTIYKVSNGVKTVAYTIAENGLHSFKLPIVNFSGNNQIWYTFALNFNREDGSNTVLSLDYYNTNIFTNSYSDIGYQLDGYNQTIDPLGNVPGTNNAIINTNNSAFEIKVTYVEPYKQLTVTLNTTYTATTPVMSVNVTDVISGISTKAFYGKSVVFNMYNNRMPVIKIVGIGAVTGYDNVFTMNQKYYRAIWFYGNESDFLNELSKSVPTYEFGTSIDYKLPVLMTDHTEVTLYVVELFSVGATSEMHSTSFGSSYPTDEDHRPSAVLTAITAKTYGGKTLPGAFVDVNKSELVDIYSTATYSTSKAHLTYSIDLNRYEFVNWNDNKNNSNETNFVVENITENTNAVAYFKIKTVSLHIATNLTNNTNYDAGITIIGHNNLTLGGLNYDYSIYDPNSIDTTTYRNQWLSGDKVMLEKYINAANYTIQPEQSVAPYGIAAEKFLIGYGEMISIKSGDISYSQVTDIWSINLLNIEYYEDGGNWYSRLVPYNTNNFVPYDFETFQEDGITILPNGYLGGVGGQILGELIVQIMFYSKYTVSLDAEIETTSQRSADAVSTYFTSDRSKLSATLPNGEVQNFNNLAGINTALINDQSTVTVRYNISQNTNGYDLSNYEFVGWRVRKHIYKDMYTQLSNDIITQNITLHGVSYVLGTETVLENGEEVVYLTITFTLNNTARDSMLVSQNLFPMFKERTKVVTINQNLAIGGTISVVDSSGNEMLGLNGLNANQFKVNAFDTYTVYVIPNDAESYTLVQKWLTISNSDFNYVAEFNPSGNYGTIMLNVIFDDSSNNLPEIYVTFTSY